MFANVLVAFAALAIACSATGAATAEPPVTATLVAGSGLIGHADGPAATASFMMPAAVAYGPDGALYVADEAAQRIRVVSTSGVVTTIAGSGDTNASGMWVDGGYRDGAAGDARFDRPDGIAVGSDGTVYVSDLGNGCVRSISHGEVRTFARGFKSPRGLDVEHDGTLYVADWGAGLVRVAPDGTLSPVVPSGVTIDRPTAVVVGHSGPHIATIFVADARGLVELQLPARTAFRTPAFQSGDETGMGDLPGDFPLGVPHALAAFDATDVVFTDLRDSSVKYFRLHAFLRYLGETPPEDAPLNGGGLDSAAAVPRFDAPMGVAIDPKGLVVVADAGNRRIVRLSTFDRRGYITPAEIADLKFEPNRYRIALVGSSYSWYFTSASDSIAGQLATQLTAVPALAGRAPQAKYFQIGRLGGEYDLIDNVLSLGAADLVVLLISPIDPYGLNLGPDPAAWSPLVHDRTEKTVAAMKAAHIPIVVVVIPAPQNLSPLEAPYLFDQKIADASSDFERERVALFAALQGIDVPTLDLFHAFRNELASVAHRPLYIAGDIHLTYHGRELVASEVARFLETLAPWQRGT